MYFFLNTECPICLKYQGSYKKITQKFADSFNFYFVFPNEKNEKKANAFCQYDSIDIKYIIMDYNLTVTKKAQATVTPQVVIMKDKNILYSGKIDDQFMAIGSQKPASINYVENVLISLLKNEPIAIQKTEPIGCFIEQ